MDIHAHHLHKAPGQKFWHYFFEFLMLFLAVFCGFMAEYHLEHRIERDREREFIASAVREMKMDLQALIPYINDSNLYKNQDTLAILLLTGNRSQETINELYRFYFNYEYTETPLIFKKNTLTQLKNAGNMRLIRKSAVVDSLLGWDGSITFLTLVHEKFEKLSDANQMLGSKIFDGGYFIQYGKWIKVEQDISANKIFRLMKNDESMLHELGTNIKNQAMYLKYYYQCLNNHKLYTTRLIEFFEKEYRL
jgi:hypothetical protein